MCSHIQFQIRGHSTMARDDGGDDDIPHISSSLPPSARDPDSRSDFSTPSSPPPPPPLAANPSFIDRSAQGGRRGREGGGAIDKQTVIRGHLPSFVPCIGKGKAERGGGGSEGGAHFSICSTIPNPPLTFAPIRELWLTPLTLGKNESSQQ